MDLKLVMFRPNGKRKDFPVSGPIAVLGRGENCDLQIPLENVSRRHCELTLTSDQLEVRDLGSSNGTFVNNKRVNELALKAGDRLVVGPVVFTIQIDGFPEEIRPVKTRGERAAEGARAVAEPAGEEIIDLEADVTTPAPETPAIPVEQPQEEEVPELEPIESRAGESDPISALEALAAESERTGPEDEQDEDGQ